MDISTVATVVTVVLTAVMAWVGLATYRAKRKKNRPELLLAAVRDEPLWLENVGGVDAHQVEIEAEFQGRPTRLPALLKGVEGVLTLPVLMSGDTATLGLVWREWVEPPLSLRAKWTDPKGKKVWEREWQLQF